MTCLYTRSQLYFTQTSKGMRLKFIPISVQVPNLKINKKKHYCCTITQNSRGSHYISEGTEVACFGLRSVLQHAHYPGEDEREEGEDAGHEQTDGPDVRRRAVEVVHEDEAQKQEHHHGQEGEDGAHAAGRERHLLARFAAAAAAAGAARARRGVALPERQRSGHRGVVGQVADPVLRHRGSAAAQGADDAPAPTLAGVQRVQALLAEGVQAEQQLGGAALPVEVVVAYLALVLLAGDGAGGVGRSGAAAASRTGRLRHDPSNWATDTALFRYECPVTLTVTFAERCRGR